MMSGVSTSTHDRPIVVALGLPRSGSTWVFNVIRSLLALSSGDVCAFYANGSNDIPVAAFMSQAPIVLKSHGLAKLPDDFLSRAKVVVSIRDPRDGVVSLMQMFRLPFDEALSRISMSARNIDAVTATSDALSLRYEDGFTNRNATIGAIAEFLGLRVDPSHIETIGEALSVDRVKQTILDLEAAQIIDAAQPQLADPSSQWHGGHIKDGRIGKYVGTLTREQEREVLSETHAFMVAHYWSVIAPPLRTGSVLSFGNAGTGNSYCRNGFSKPERGAIWTDEADARIVLPLTEAIRDELALTLCFTPAASALGTTTTFDCRLNDAVEVHRSYRPDTGQVDLSVVVRDPALAGTSLVDVALRFEGLASPAELGLSSDERKLGILLRSLDIQYH